MTKNYSDDYAKIIDEEVEQILKRQKKLHGASSATTSKASSASRKH